MNKILPQRDKILVRIIPNPSMKSHSSLLLGANNDIPFSWGIVEGVSEDIVSPAVAVGDTIIFPKDRGMVIEDLDATYVNIESKFIIAKIHKEGDSK